MYYESGGLSPSNFNTNFYLSTVHGAQMVLNGAKLVVALTKILLALENA